MKSNKISKWCKIVNLGRFSAMFHTLTMAVVYLPSKAIKKMLTVLDGDNHSLLLDIFDEETLLTLENEKLLLPIGYNEALELDNIRAILLDNVTLEMMYLILSDNCNLKCSYCFEDAPVHDKSLIGTNMDERVCREAIRCFSRLSDAYGNKDRSKIIHLYGGEPLLNFDSIVAAVDEVKTLKSAGKFSSGVDFVLITNGVFLDDKVADFIAENNIKVGISIDGPEDINNMYRIPKSSGVNIFKAASSAFERLKKRNVQIGLSATLTPEAVLNFDRVLNFFVNEFGIRDGLSFNIMHYNPSMKVDEDYFEKAAEVLIKAYDLFRVKGIYEERMMRKITAFVTREAMFADCGVVGSQIVVAPDGKIGVCQDFVKPRTYYQGNVLDANIDPIKSGLFDDWKHRSPFFMSQCEECEAIAICGGGCPASIELITGDRWNVDNRICAHSKKTLKWLLVNTLINISK